MAKYSEFNSPSASPNGSVSVNTITGADDLPIDPSLGENIFDIQNNTLYTWTGGSWRSTALINESPEITSAPDEVDLALNGSPVTVILEATDPEGFPLSWDYASLDLNSQAVIVKNTSNNYTITPIISDNLEFTITFTVSDGASQQSKNIKFSNKGIGSYSGPTSGIIKSASALELTEPGEYTLTVTTPFSSTLSIWGAAGGGLNGGYGGYLTGEHTFAPGTYVIWVGGGGRVNNVNISGAEGGFGGGGLAGRTNSSQTYSSSGGGLTGIFSETVSQATAMAISGGGGGASLFSLGMAGAYAGGNGGGTTGLAGGGGAGQGGGGGTQDAGGSRGIPSDGGQGQNGSALQGGNGASDLTTNFTAAGGGGGYFGGGSGGGDDGVGGAGGGGSGYQLGITGPSIMQTGVGVGQADPYYIAPAGNPATESGAGQASGNGLFVIHTISEISWFQQQKIEASDNLKGGNRFGVSVAISGDTVVVGAFNRAEFGVGTDLGAAYIFTRSGSTWTQQQKIQSDDIEAGDQFGTSVDIDGDTIIVGAPFETTGGSQIGSAYIFTRSGSTWTQQQKIQASDKEANDRFGSHVAISGDTVIIGVNFEDTGGFAAGAAYIFTRSGSTWTQQQKIQSDDIEAGDQFGADVDIDGDTIVVGANGENTGGSAVGAAYIFTRSGSTWTQQQKIQASDKEANDFFGSRLAISSDTVIVGATGEDTGGDSAGAAYIFTRSGTTWTQQQKIQASDIQASDFFGGAVAIEGNTVIVSAKSEDDGGDNAGAAYIFTRDGTSWTQQAKILASDAQANDSFGESVSISGSSIIVGASQEDSGGSNAGAAYIFGGPDNLNFENMSIGTATNGGFFAGIIDTTKDNIIAADDYQTGARYALIVSPREYEAGRAANQQAAGLPTGDLRWDAADRLGQSGSFTRWDGLASTNSILLKNDPQYEVFEFIRTLRTAYPVPNDGGSDWYLPALDELELLYRNFKPTDVDNVVRTNEKQFPGTQTTGFNPSSDPTGAAYTADSPAQTSVTETSIFKNTYWSSTDADEERRVWVQNFTRFLNEGSQSFPVKSATDNSVRPVRRILL